MKKAIIIVLVILVLIGSFIYFDYFNVKTNNTSPKISIKENLTDDQILYKAVFYKVWYCKTNKTYTIGSYSDTDAVCPINYEYIDGYYTNAEGVKISKRDLQLLTNDGIYTSEMIETMSDNTQVQDAVHVAYDYGIYKYKKIDKESEDNHELIVFPKFEEVDGNYKWIYDEEDLYCLKDDSFAKYDTKCGKFEKIKMDNKWCESYKTSTLVYEDNIEKYCEE